MCTVERNSKDRNDFCCYAWHESYQLLPLFDLFCYASESLSKPC